MNALISIDPAYILLAGLFANFATAAVKREHWSANVTKTATVILSAISGFVAVLAQQKGLHAQAIGYSIAGTLGVNQAAYALLVKGTPLGAALNNVFNPAVNPTDANTTLAAEDAATVVDTPAAAPKSDPVPVAVTAANAPVEAFVPPADPAPAAPSLVTPVVADVSQPAPSLAQQ